MNRNINGFIMTLKKGKRELYIDVIKGLAMVSVIADHTSSLGGILNTYFHIFHSIMLFVLVMGFNLYFSFKRKEDAGESIKLSPFDSLKRLKTFFVFYTFATIIILFVRYHKFDLFQFIDTFIYFKGDGAYYFICMYIQLILVSAVVYKVVSFSKNMLSHLLILAAVYGLSSFFVSYTLILPHLHGGGKFLLGGTWFLLFVIGFFIAKGYAFFTNGVRKYIVFIFLMIACYFYAPYVLIFWGNPPLSFMYIIYGVTSFLVLIFLSSIIKDVQSFLVKKNIVIPNALGRILLFPFNYLAAVGRYSLHIFLYQGLLISLTMDKVSPYITQGGGTRYS